MPNTTEIPPWKKPADRRTKVWGFRIYLDQKDYLTQTYKSKQNAVIRLLLDKLKTQKLPQEILDEIAQLPEYKT